MWFLKRNIFTAVACGIPILGLQLDTPRDGTSVQIGARTVGDAACNALAAVFSGSNVSRVFWPGSENYTSDVSHYSESMIQMSTCAAEPGTPEDVSTILKIVAKMRTPFAVKSGGHIMNPGFASTPGVQISLSRFADIAYDPDAQTVRVGSGLRWGAVYAALAPHNVSVIGGRNPDVGVGGLLMGGGYSYKTNQFGLGIDNIVSMETVLPNGTVVDVTAEAHPDLWFALRGGGNNFGIVTNFVLKTHPQSAIWAGVLLYAEDQIPAFINASARYATGLTDPKSAALIGFGATTGFPGFIAMATLYYDAPEPPAGLFDDFLAIPFLSDTTATQSLVDFLGPNDPPVQRATSESVPLVNYTIPMLQAIVEETNRTVVALGPVNTTIFICEPFIPSILAHGPASAYPSQRHTALLPGDITVIYEDPSADQLVHDTIVATGLRLSKTAAALGQKEADPDSPDSSMYSNYAAWGTPVERLYGQNLPRLKEIKKRYDPEDIMGLAGGFKITP